MRSNAHSYRNWEITVEPSGRDDVTVTLTGGRACGTAGTVCTRGDDPRPLSNSLSATVAGPPPLTASFNGIPAEHDGENPFTFRLAFSELVKIRYATLRDRGAERDRRHGDGGKALSANITETPAPLELL